MSKPQAIHICNHPTTIRHPQHPQPFTSVTIRHPRLPQPFTSVTIRGMGRTEGGRDESREGVPGGGREGRKEEGRDESREGVPDGGRRDERRKAGMKAGRVCRPAWARGVLVRGPYPVRNRPALPAVRHNPLSCFHPCLYPPFVPQSSRRPPQPSIRLSSLPFPSFRPSLPLRPPQPSIRLSSLPSSLRPSHPTDGYRCERLRVLRSSPGYRCERLRVLRSSDGYRCERLRVLRSPDGYRCERLRGAEVAGWSKGRKAARQQCAGWLQMLTAEVAEGAGWSPNVYKCDRLR